MRAAFPVAGCAELLEKYVKPPSLGPDWVYCGCDRIELTVLCLTAGFNGWFELRSEYTDRGPCPLNRVDARTGEVAVALNGSTLSRRTWVNPQCSLQHSRRNVYKPSLARISAGLGLSK